MTKPMRVYPLAVTLQTELRALTDRDAPLGRYPHMVDDLLPRCGGSRSELDRLVRRVRDITHTVEFFDSRTGALVPNHRRMPGYAIPPVDKDTQGRLIMGRGLDHLAFAMICSTVRSAKHTRTRGFNVMEQMENIVSLVPRGRYRTVLNTALHIMHTMYDPYDLGLHSGGLQGNMIELLGNLLNGISVEERIYIDSLIQRAVA
jgi:hypothetical protein